MPTATTTMVHARVDSSLKKEATKVLKEMGLTMSDAFRLFIVKTAKEKTIPFEIWMPNKTTVKAMEDVRAGRAAGRSKTAKGMLAELKK
jgi:DNA-damage-inducible protein J